MVARARKTDPSTSHEAAESVADISVLQKNLLDIFKRTGRGLTDEQLVERYNTWRMRKKWASASPQSIRSRRSELVVKGYIEFDGEYGVTVFGRKTRVWRLSPTV